MSCVPDKIVITLQLFASSGQGWEDAFQYLLKSGMATHADRAKIRKYFLQLNAVSKRYGTGR